MVISKVSTDTENLIVGDTLTLEISASGTYEDIGWFLNGQLFAVWLSTDKPTFLQCPDMKCRFEEYGKRLVIDGVTAQHNGIYDAKLFEDFEMCNASTNTGCGGELETFTRNIYGEHLVYHTTLFTICKKYNNQNYFFQKIVGWTKEWSNVQ